MDPTDQYAAELSELILYEAKRGTITEIEKKIYFDYQPQNSNDIHVT